jgi:hypothetical protein
VPFIEPTVFAREDRMRRLPSDVVNLANSLGGELAAVSRTLPPLGQLQKAHLTAQPFDHTVKSCGPRRKTLTRFSSHFVP